MQTLQPRPTYPPEVLSATEVPLRAQALQVVVRRQAASSADDAPAMAGLLAQRLPKAPGEADATDVALALAASWEALEEALVPVIGQLGVAGLFKRAIQLTGIADRWLPCADPGDPGTPALAALQSALCQQSADVANVAGEELLQAINDLLISLLGASLTASLLRRVWVAKQPESGPSSP
jgi:hypothetical protein